MAVRGRFAALTAFLAGDPPADDDDQDTGAGGADGDDDDADGKGSDDDDQAGSGDGSDGDDGAGDDGEAGAGKKRDKDKMEDGDDDAPAAEASAATLAERRRWAAVLSSTEAEGKTEAATALLVENMSAGAIKRVLSSMPKDNGLASRLSSTPRHDLRARPGQEAGKADAGAGARKKAVARRNATVGGQGVKARAAGQQTTRGNAAQQGE